MGRTFTVHKVTHKFFGPNGTPAIAVAQKRGDTLMINRLESGQIVEKARAVGSCAYHLTGYGKGVPADDARQVASMQSAWRFMFGLDIPSPVTCEIHKESF